MSTASVNLSVRPSTVTLRDIKQACKAYSSAQATRHAQEAADAAKKAAFMRVFEALLGVKSEDEVRTLSPEALTRLARRRISQGLVKIKGIDPDLLLSKVIQKVRSERRPEWKKCFITRLGESAAVQVQEATEETFSYKFVEP